jgi:RND family efflux transporter MFP subunit
MNNDKRAGLLQITLVVLFIVSSFALSKILEIQYEPPTRNNTAERVLYVETAKISPEPYRISFETTGLVQARNEIRIVPEVSGRVIAVHESFFAGGAFRDNEVLFEIEPRDYILDVRRLEAEVARARTALELERAESSAALAEWRQINGDVPAPDLVVRVPQLAEVQAILQSAEAQLENAKLDLARTRFTLPFDGRVMSSDIAVGQYVMAGQGYGMVFDISNLEISASLVDRQLEWLLQGGDPQITVYVTFRGKQREYKGNLKRTASSLDAGTRFATVYFGFDDAIEELLPGVFARINIKGEQLNDISLLPLSALQTQNVVWQVTAEKTLNRWEPEIIYQDPEYIVARGLSEPAVIVTSRVNGATQGMRVATAAEARSPVIQP